MFLQCLTSWAPFILIVFGPMLVIKIFVRAPLLRRVAMLAWGTWFTGLVFVVAVIVGGVLWNASSNSSVSDDLYFGMAGPEPSESERVARISANGAAPAAYLQLVYRVASDQGFSEPELLMGIIQQESAWDPNATSSAGAMGLMQLMPGTAADMGVTNAYDPEQNVRGGTKYIAWLLDRYGGDTRKAVMAYHAGPGNMESRGPTSLDIYYADMVLGYYEDFRAKASVGLMLPFGVDSEQPSSNSASTNNPYWPYRGVSPPPFNKIHGDGYWPGRDYLTPAGTPLYAPEICPCTVTRKGFDSYVGPYGTGNSYILFRSLDGEWEVMYMHGDYTASGTVSPGEFIGTEASIGNSSHPHTHVSVRRNGVLVDPEDY